MMAMVAINAAEVTFDFSKQSYSNAQSFDGQTITLAEGVTASFDKGTNKTVPAYYTTGTAIRLYGSNTMTITSTIGNITAMTIQFSANSKAEEKLVANAGKWAVENTVGTWAGAAQEVVFTYDATSGHARVKTITITLGAAPKVATPEITATEKNFTEKTTITISGEEGAAIYYTTDGTEPDNTKTAYKASFDVTETTTIKAIAYKGADASSVASLTVTKMETIGVTEARARIDASTKGACYVRGIVSSDNIGSTWPGYANIWMRDITNDTDTLEAYKMYKDANQTKFESAEEVGVRKGDTIVVYAADLTKYKTTYETTTGYLVSVTPGERPAVEKPYIAVSEKNFKDSAIIKITCATEGAKIYYTTDESDPTTASKEYTDSIIVKETTTIKAIAVLNEDTSEVATYTVNKIEILTIAEVNEKAVNDNVAFYATVVEVATTGAMLGDETGYIYYFNQSHKLQKGEKVFVTGALSLSTQGGYKGPKQVTNTAKIDSLDMTTVTDPTPVKMDGPALKTWANAPEVKYIKIQGKLVKSGSYINIELEGVEKFDGSLLTPKFDVSALVDQDVIVTGYAFCATGTSTVHANIMATSVVARAASKTEVNFNTAEVTVTADPFITFELGGEAQLFIDSWAGGNAFANKYIGGTYDIDLAEGNTFELTVGGKEVELVEGELIVTYVDCKKDYSQNLYEFKLNAYTADAVLYYSCDTIWTSVKPDNTYVAEDNINVNATTATSIASEMKADEVTNRAYNIFGYLVKIDDKYYYLNDDKNATAGFVAYNPTVSGNVAVGDYVRVNAKMTNYKGNTPETNGTAKLQAWDINNLPVLRATTTVDTIPATVAKAVEIGAALAENATSKEVYEVTGFVVVAYDADEKGEQSWYMCDTMITDTTNFDSFKKELLMVQFTKADRNVVVGDNMTVWGKIMNYKKSDGTKEYITIRNAAATHNNATGIWNNEATEQKAAKFIENGRIVIRRGEKKYTIVGQAY